MEEERRARSPGPGGRHAGAGSEMGESLGELGRLRGPAWLG